MSRPVHFGENLRLYRTKHGFTQKQLAAQIGYTEKSISKWETGSGLPTMEMLLRLADLFQISLDELMFEKNSGYYFLGIDGGSTKTTFLLADEAGTALRRLYKGPSNPNDIGMEQASAVLKEGIQEICNGIPYSRVILYAGLSGGGMTGNYAELFRQFFQKFGFHAFGNGSDIDNLIALSDSEACILVIMGTGFLVYARNGTDRKRIAGWGQFFDAGGSGYALGRDAISAALSAGDGSGADTLLTALLEERLGETAEAHLAKFYQGGKRYIAGFSELVFLAAERGDPVARGILEQNMAFVAEKIRTALRGFPGTDKPIPVLFSGGISENEAVLFPLIVQHLPGKHYTLTRLRHAPVDGAIRQARIIFESQTPTK